MIRAWLEDNEHIALIGTAIVAVTGGLVHLAVGELSAAAWAMLLAFQSISLLYRND